MIGNFYHSNMNVSDFAALVEKFVNVFCFIFHYCQRSEYIIQNVVGCGPFQVILVLLVFVVTKLSMAYTMMFMSFGNYNPGWRCLDSNDTVYNETSKDNSSMGYNKDNCQIFESCTDIEFDPDTSTIVSEWGLLCDKAWIPSIIISIQMAGVLTGCAFAGYVGDVIGRKTVIYGAQGSLVIFNFISVFASSWQMFAALRFFIGISIAGIVTLYYLYSAEFVTIRWRAPLPHIPSWPICCIIFAVTCMYLKDWRHIHLVGAATAAVGFVPVLWVPESLRWLEVKNKTTAFQQAAGKMAKMNGKSLPPLENINTQHALNNGDRPRRYNVLSLFKRGYRVYSILIVVPWFFMSLIFYAIGFGIKALSGNFYYNMIILYAMEIPFAPIPAVAPNVFGRKISGAIFAGFTGVLLMGSAFVQLLASGNSKVVGVLVLVTAGRISIGALGCIIMTYTVEIYPTVVRGQSTSWGNTMARIGGIIAPFLIPSDPSKVFTSYMVMGALGMLCCGIIVLLPETRGRILKETFHDTDDEVNHMHSGDCVST